MTTRPAKPTVRYSAIKSARTVGSANVELHHHGGRDQRMHRRSGIGDFSSEVSFENAFIISYKCDRTDL